MSHGNLGHCSEDDGDEEIETQFMDAIAADNGSFHGKDLALASMDYFRWLRGDNLATEALGGNRFLHQQTRAELGM